MPIATFMNDSRGENQSSTPARGFFGNLPPLASFYFLGSSLFFVGSELLCLIHILLLHRRGHLPLVRLGMPVLIFLPWGYCLKGLRSLSRMTAHNPELGDAMTYLAMVPFWAYLLFISASEFWK